ncbi:Rec8 like protein-domain-containing protein [Roridomyces roridus]|uniref:Rec8 like protein-domain-containing protein n=1 Tax=Roridomyces roridus TaxID=1738132 RepID=A0AAD7FLB0_9AGAR|nr:Rec8 like protein-domain-containing protein [Roridomyces roridus]
MFFSPELLAKRDGGFGLLWLAATLGSKSTFKKLPKRSVLTADISELCDLIVTPPEPLALRLSSNLMIGVARVYKVKQEIFMTDVTNCVASLKKVVQEMQSAAKNGDQLQMAQPSARPSALNLAKDPKAAFVIEFDALVADWDAFLNIGGEQLELEEPESEDEFDPKTKGKKANRKQKPSSQRAEEPRADMYTLKEDHEHLLSNSFDLSFNADVGGMASSSQNGGGFALDDIFLSAPDSLDIGDGLGDDFAKELGEGWGLFPDENNAMDLDGPLGNDGLDIQMDLDFGQPFDAPQEDLDLRSQSEPAVTPKKRKAGSARDKENKLPSSIRKKTPEGELSPATSFSRLLLTQDQEEPQPPLLDVTADRRNQGVKKVKKTRLLLDARTELTDEELKAARAQYLQGQTALRRQLEEQKIQKEGGKILDDMFYRGVPRGVQAESLVEFWQANFQVQVEARTGVLVIHDEPPAKRRKIRDPPNEDANDMIPAMFDNDFNMQDVDFGDMNNGGGPLEQDPIRRSSEEPGQARHISRPPSILGNDFDFGAPAPSGSQRSSLFPWDNAGGGSSSAGGFGAMGSDRVSVDRAEVAIRSRGGSLSRRGSSLVPSQSGSALEGLEFSPGLQKGPEDYAFDVDQQPNDSGTFDSQRSDMNLITLERNSFNFLEYVRMQLQGLPSSVPNLSFDAVVPMATSTRHVAAAAFYHCLVLATKDLLHLKQDEPYGELCLTIG